MECIPGQTVVRNKETEIIGVTCDKPSLLARCTKKTPVIYEGSTVVINTLTESLEVIGPENARAEPERCGAGRDEECCIFLVFTKKRGFECQRFGPLRRNLILRKEEMDAKREPIQLYPACQLPPRSRGGSFIL